MHESADSAFYQELRNRMHAAQDELSRRWLGEMRRHATSLTAHTSDVSTQSEQQPRRGGDAAGPPGLDAALAPHASSIVCSVADFVTEPAAPVTSDSPLYVAATRIAGILQEHGLPAPCGVEVDRLLGDVLCDFAEHEARDHRDVAPAALIGATRRILHACTAISRLAGAICVHALRAGLAARDDRLENVRGRLTHELKNRIGAVIGAGQLLQEEWIGAAERARFAEMVVANAEFVRQAIVDLSALVRLDGPAEPELATPADAAPSA